MTDWDRLVREQAPQVFATAWRILGHAADTEDVVQDVFLQAHRFQQSRAVRSWPALLRKLAACRALDRLRRRRPVLTLDDADPPSPGDGPEATAIAEELRQRLRAAIAQLPAREAEVFCLRYFEELPNGTIAELLSMTTGAVATALSKARARLEAVLSPKAPSRVTNLL